jgi:hypothetical protein
MSVKRIILSRIGSYALDGCEILFAEIEETVEFLKRACNCHINFHHIEVVVVNM